MAWILRRTCLANQGEYTVSTNLPFDDSVSLFSSEGIYPECEFSESDSDELGESDMGSKSGISMSASMSKSSLARSSLVSELEVDSSPEVELVFDSELELELSELIELPDDTSISPESDSG